MIKRLRNYKLSRNEAFDSYDYVRELNNEVQRKNRHTNQRLFTDMFIKDVDNSVQNLLEILSDNSLDVYRLTLEDEGEPISREKALRTVRRYGIDYLELYKHADGCCVDVVDPESATILFTAVPD